MIDRTIDLHMGVAAAPPIVECTEGDTMWRWRFRIFWQEKRWTIPPGSVVMFTGKKADGNVFDLAETLASNEVVVDADEQITAAVGPVACVVRVIDPNGKTVASCPVVLAVKPNPQTQGPMSETVLSAYNDVLQMLGGAISVPTSVTDWLNAHVSPETGYVIDNSLTIEGAAADAKATGDAIDLIKGAMASLSFTYTTPIPADTDIDTLKDFGNYSIASVSVAETLVNLPDGFANAGRLFVMQAQSRYRYMQILFDANTTPQMWMRYFNGTKWYPWKLFCTDYSNVLSLAYAHTIAIETNTDLDTLKDFGNYSIASASVADTLINLPADFTNAGRLFVMQAQSRYRYMQILFEGDTVPKMWMRYWNGSSWTDWVRFAQSDEVDEIAANVSQLETKLSDDISRVETMIKVSNGELINCGWIVGRLTNGYPAGNTSLTDKRIISDYIFVGQNTSVTISEAGYNFNVSVYDLDKVYTGAIPASGWNASGAVVTLDKDCYIRIMARKTDDSVLTDDDIPTIVSNIEMDYYSPTVTDYQLSLDSVPSYYDTQLEAAVDTIRSNMNACGQNGDTFIFITDLHWDPSYKHNNRNARRSPSLVKRIIEETGLKKVVFGGDYFTGNDDPDFEFDQLRNLFNAFNIKNTLFFPIMGNHDWNGYNTTTGQWDDATAYAQIIKQCENNVSMGDDLNYYYDVPSCKTRYIMLNTHSVYSKWTAQDAAKWTAQLSWLNTVLSGTSNGYKIVVLMHIYFDVGGAATEYAITLSKQGEDVANACDAFNSGSSGAKVVAIISGHAHRDYDTTTPGGIPVLLTDCDSSVQVLSGRDATRGTVGENCFDVITLDYVNNKVNTVRVGRGGADADRSISLYT